MTRPAEVKAFRAPAPSWARNEMYYIADAYDFIFEPHDHFEKTQVVVPGFFNEYRGELNVGTRITCRLGKIEDGILELELQVIKTSKTDRQINVEVSVGLLALFAADDLTHGFADSVSGCGYRGSPGEPKPHPDRIGEA